MEQAIMQPPEARSSRLVACRLIPGHDPHLAVLFCLPLFALLISTNWIFTPPKTIDPWVYYGYFRNFVHFKSTLFPGTYYGSRLSYVIPGYIANQSLPPLLANYALHLFYYYVAVFSLYYILKSMVGRRAALLGGVSLGSYVFFLKAVGWDYFDGPVIAYYLLCLALLTRAGYSNRPWFWLALAGASYASLIYANLFAVIFSPLFPAHYLVVARRSAPRRLYRLVLNFTVYCTSGAVALTILFGLVNFVIAGTAWFYLPSVNYALDNVGKTNPWKSDTYHWVMRAKWLVFPILTLAGSGLWLWLGYSSKPDTSRSFARLLIISFGLSFALMVAWELGGMPVLQYDYYTSFLIPSTFLALGCLPAAALGRLSWVSFHLLIALSVIAATLPLWGRMRWMNQLEAPYGLVVPIAVGLVGVVSVIVWADHWKSAWLYAICICVCHLTLATATYPPGERHLLQDSFRRIATGAEAIRKVAGSRPVRFWYSKKEASFSEFNALNSIYLWGYTSIGVDFPNLSPRVAVDPGVVLVIPSAETQILERANRSLESRHLVGSLLSKDEIHYNGVGYSLNFIQLRETE